MLITFATESFGIECGRLAGLPESILAVASKCSSTLQHDVKERSRRKKYVFCGASSAYYLPFLQDLPNYGTYQPVSCYWRH
jgi:DNA mismatch repair protein MSH3